MRTAALTIGVVGGIFGILTALLALLFGGIGAAAGNASGGSVIGYALAAFMFCMLGFLGAGLAASKGRLGAAILLVAGIGYGWSLSIFALVTTPLFLIAALLAFAGRTRRTQHAQSTWLTQEEKRATTPLRRVV